LRFLLDMGISYQVAQWLNSVGHDAIHISNEGQHTLDDHLIVEKAINENRVILTADMDFGQILAFTKSNLVSVIQFRLFDLSPANIISKLNLVFDNFTEEMVGDQVIITIQQNKMRIKKLPL
jgi:predicted nuclease of predicted toxin-antitoxin system